MVKEKKKIDKISIEMEKSRERQAKIDQMTNELYEETRPMMVEKMKEEIEEAKREKESFDQMNKESILFAEKEILGKRKILENNLKNKIIETAEKQDTINKKLSSMKKKFLENSISIDIMDRANESARKALDNANAELSEFQKRNSDLMNKLQAEEKTLRGFALELGIEEEFDKTEIEEDYEPETAYELDEEEIEDLEIQEGKEEEKEEGKKTNQSNPLTAQDIMEDLLKIQQTTNKKDFDELIDVLEEKYADASDTCIKRLNDALINKKNKLEQNPPKAPEKPKNSEKNEEKKPETNSRRPEQSEVNGHDDFAEIEEIFKQPQVQTQERKEEPVIPKVEEVIKPKVTGYETKKRKTGVLHPQMEDVEVGEDEEKHTDSSTKIIKRIEIDEATGQISVIGSNNNVIYSKQFVYDMESEEFVLADGYDYEQTDAEFEEYIDTVEKIKDSIKKEYGLDLYEQKIKGVDGRIFQVLADMKKEDVFEDYIYSIFEKDETLPFQLSYNLKDIYNTDMSLEEIKEIQNYSKVAQKQNKEMVDIEKDSLPKRIFGRIKKGIQDRIERRMLSSGEDSMKKPKKENDSKRQEEQYYEDHDIAKPNSYKDVDFKFGVSHDEYGNSYEPDHQKARANVEKSNDINFVIAPPEEKKSYGNNENDYDDYMF